MRMLSKIAKWLDERTGLGKPLIDMATHLVPPGSRWSYVFGTATMTAFVVQVVTGIALSTHYVPSGGHAYESLRFITFDAPYGKLLRGMHYFGASAMIFPVGVHMIRVFVFASYKFPRELNWVTGVVLLFITVAMGFTGQILRWDQNAVWTVAVGAEQALRTPLIGKYLVNILLSGGFISSSTIGHFFSLHVFILPAILIAFIGLHVYLVLHNGISEPPVLGETVDPQTYRQKYEEMLKKVGRPFWPESAFRDAIFSTGVAVCILLLAALIGAPALDRPPDPSIIQAQPHPDWYLLWYFALLALLPHNIEDWCIILVPLLGVLMLIFVPFVSNKGERNIERRPWSIASMTLIVSSIAALTYEGVHEPWTPDFEAKPLTANLIGASAGIVYDGAKVFNDKGCLFCHTYAGHGGKRGPDLSNVYNRLTDAQIKIRIVNGGYNMPAYAGNIKPEELAAVAAFLEHKRSAPGARGRPAREQRE